VRASQVAVGNGRDEAGDVVVRWATLGTSWVGTAEATIRLGKRLFEAPYSPSDLDSASEERIGVEVGQVGPISHQDRTLDLDRAERTGPDALAAADTQPVVGPGNPTLGVHVERPGGTADHAFLTPGTSVRQDRHVRMQPSELARLAHAMCRKIDDCHRECLLVPEP
jgi:hypothetical protein